VAELRHELLEAVVEHDDAILHKYLEEHELTEDEIRTVLRKATVAGHVVPMLCGAAFKNKGVQALLDVVVDYLPSPVDVRRSRAISRTTTPPTPSAPPATRPRSRRSRSRS